MCCSPRSAVVGWHQSSSVAPANRIKWNLFGSSGGIPSLHGNNGNGGNGEGRGDDMDMAVDDLSGGILRHGRVIAVSDNLCALVLAEQPSCKEGGQDDQ